jgi:hypothetical protein
MLEHMPNLAFVPVEKLLIHEWHDDQRTPPLIERILASRVFRNPPIVSPLNDGSGRYMVLDGANRTTALQKMGYPHALVQVVNPDDPGLKLLNWNHVVWGLAPQAFLEGVQAISEVRLLPGKSDRASLWGERDLAIVQIADGERYSVCTDTPDLKRRVGLLNAVVDSYIQRASLDRTSDWSVVRLVAAYKQLSGLVIFPRFDINQVLSLAGQGCLLPSGITRFQVSPRALHVNYPLEALAADQPLEEKNAILQRWLQERIERKGVRYYSEATFLFDE